MLLCVCVPVLGSVLRKMHNCDCAKCNYDVHTDLPSIGTEICYTFTDYKTVSCCKTSLTLFYRSNWSNCRRINRHTDCLDRWQQIRSNWPADLTHRWVTCVKMLSGPEVTCEWVAIVSRLLTIPSDSDVSVPNGELILRVTNWHPGLPGLACRQMTIE
jgi:hypothetical protein